MHHGSDEEDYEGSTTSEYRMPIPPVPEYVHDVRRSAEMIPSDKQRTITLAEYEELLKKLDSIMARLTVMENQSRVILDAVMFIKQSLPKYVTTIPAASPVYSPSSTFIRKYY